MILRRRKKLLIPVIMLSVVAYVFLLQDRFDDLYSGYIEAEYDSSGTLVRLAMNALPATLFMIYNKRFVISENARLLWRLLSAVALAMLPAFVLMSSSTALDRLGLYFIPVQVYVFGHLAPLVGGSERGARLIRFLVILYYSAVLFVWLNYADNSGYWLPYRFLLMQ